MEWKDRLLFAYDLQWFAKDGPGGEKTEPATEKKLREARVELIPLIMVFSLLGCLR